MARRGRRSCMWVICGACDRSNKWLDLRHAPYVAHLGIALNLSLPVPSPPHPHPTSPCALTQSTWDSICSEGWVCAQGLQAHVSRHPHSAVACVWVHAQVQNIIRWCMCGGQGGIDESHPFSARRHTSHRPPVTVNVVHGYLANKEKPTLLGTSQDPRGIGLRQGPS